MQVMTEHISQDKWQATCKLQRDRQIWAVWQVFVSQTFSFHSHLA